MARLTRSELKALWVKFFKPAASDYANLFDSFINIEDDGTIIYRPTTEPVLSGSDMPINMIDAYQGMFEPRSTSGTRTISSNFTIIISNDSNADLISMVFSLTGTVTVTFPSDVYCSNAGSIGTWTNGAKTLELAAGTDDRIEFQLLKDRTTGDYFLKISDPLIS